MASMAMAQAVLEHAHQFYDVDNWYVVAECWDALAVLEELDQQEERSQVPFRLDTAAISHFAGLLVDSGGCTDRARAAGVEAARDAVARTNGAHNSRACDRASWSHDRLGLVIRSVEAGCCLPKRAKRQINHVANGNGGLGFANGITPWTYT